MTKEFYDAAYSADKVGFYCGGLSGRPARIADHWKQTTFFLESIGIAQNNTAKVLEIGPGMSFLAKIHPGWHGAEYSSSAVEFVRHRDGESVRIFEEDAQNLSFDSEYFDAIFSWATFEHVPEPDKALLEVDRVLRRGGYALIAPAWNCRPWVVKKIQERPWCELSFLEKLERITIPVRNNLLFRAAVALPRRLQNELGCYLARKNYPLQYKALHPRWDLIEKYGHRSDDDAVADIDAHSAILFFKSRGYLVRSHPSFLRRLIERHEPVVVYKAPLSVN